eukprot:TRINITY_DN50782_c0_g1_i1.p1 TRINITY_DN50782_c0_g1~~TRINITY_DN50782_c0_g1_i1.p1  ORF type:complete len:215 (-),score=43.63 TRINITY_DN50782_c0_g1_i1:58-624(-)
MCIRDRYQRRVRGMDYLQGKCSWGDQCKQLHPPNLKGSLPLECRLGDWKCVCGTINRHFRRRCSSCPKEKPQYRRDQQVSVEEDLLTHPETFTEEFRHQFGYNPNAKEEALKYWRKRFAILDRDAAVGGGSGAGGGAGASGSGNGNAGAVASSGGDLSLIHISEPTRLLSISYAVFCLKKKKKHIITY